MEIISVRVGNPSQTPAVNIENPSQVNATLENVNIQTGGTAQNAVLYDPQDLTDAQKEQARTNIAAASQADLDAQAEKIEGKQPAGNYITEETDPTVPAWAKEPTKPTYTANEIGARPATWTPTASEIGALPDTTKIPANTSDLTNDSGFITKTVNDLANYYLKSETYSKAELDNKISAIPKFSIEVVGSLPTTGISDTTVYLLASGNEQDNLYTEYIYVNGAWEYLGKQTVDLTGYVKRTELSAYYTSIEIDSLLTTIRNSIPTKLSQLTEDSSHRLVTDNEKLSWNEKADKATTLAGYGITDGATKEDFNGLSEEIANYLPKNQGAGNVGKILVVGTDGNLVLTEMPEGQVGDVVGTIDENNNILLSGDIADGTYKLKYEYDDGDIREVGSIVISSIVTYSITKTLSNCTASGATTINKGSTATVTITANSGYELPDSITVSGASYTWDKASGKIVLSNPTGNVAITVTAEETVVTPSYTNLLPLSVNADGSDYKGTNGEDGYKAGYKMSTSGGGESATSGAYCSGFMPITDIYSTIRVKNIVLSNTANVNNFVFYDSTKTKINPTSTCNGTAGAFHASVRNEGNGVYSFEPSNFMTEEKGSDIAFFRFSCGGITDETIVTVNEEIV